MPGNSLPDCSDLSEKSTPLMQTLPSQRTANGIKQKFLKPHLCFLNLNEAAVQELMSIDNKPRSRSASQFLSWRCQSWQACFFLSFVLKCNPCFNSCQSILIHGDVNPGRPAAPACPCGETSPPSSHFQRQAKETVLSAIRGF